MGGRDGFKKEHREGAGKGVETTRLLSELRPVGGAVPKQLQNCMVASLHWASREGSGKAHAKEAWNGKHGKKPENRPPPNPSFCFSGARRRAAEKKKRLFDQNHKSNMMYVNFDIHRWNT